MKFAFTQDRTWIPFGLAVCFFASVPNAFSQTAGTDDEIRELALRDCIDLALEHNLNLQIERVNVEIAENDLNGSLSLYQPNFNFNFQDTSTTTEGSFNVDLGVQNANSVFEGNNFSAGFNSQLPMGLRISNLGVTWRENQTSVNPINILDYTTRVGIDLQQPLLRNFWIDGARANIKINRRRVENAGLGLRLQIMNIVASVERAYYDLIAAKRNVEVQEQALELARELLTQNQKRVELGTMAKLEESQARSQVASREADLLNATNAFENQQNVLKNLITDRFQEWANVNLIPSESLLQIPGEFDLQESWTNALERRPDLIQLQVNLSINDIQLRLAKNQLFPELNLIGGYSRRGQDGRLGITGDLGRAFGDIEAARNPSHYYGVVLNVPLGFMQERNNYRSAMAAKAQSKLRVKQFEQNILVEVDNLVRLARTNFERVEARRQARLFAKEALEAEEKKYSNGISTSFIVLDLQNQFTAAQFAEAQALAAYNRTLADLALSEGTILQRNQINLEFE